MNTLAGTLEPTGGELKAGELSSSTLTGLYREPVAGSNKDGVENDDATWTYTFAFDSLTA